MKNKLVLFIIFMIFPYYSESSNRNLYLKIIQNNTTIKVSDLNSIDLKKEAFAFLFPLKEYDNGSSNFYSVMITASVNQSIFNIKQGMNINEIPFLKSGSGFSGYDGEYPYLILSEIGNHYIMYSKSDKESQRASLVLDFKDSYYEVSWTIRKINIDMKTGNEKAKEIVDYITNGQDYNKTNKNYMGSLVNITDYPLNKIYFILFSDMNFNNRIEANEFIRFSVNFIK